MRINVGRVALCGLLFSCAAACGTLVDFADCIKNKACDFGYGVASMTGDLKYQAKNFAVNLYNNYQESNRLAEQARQQEEVKGLTNKKLFLDRPFSLQSTALTQLGVEGVAINVSDFFVQQADSNNKKKLAGQNFLDQVFMVNLVSKNKMDAINDSFAVYSDLGIIELKTRSGSTRFNRAELPTSVLELLKKFNDTNKLFSRFNSKREDKMIFWDGFVNENRSSLSKCIKTFSEREDLRPYVYPLLSVLSGKDMQAKSFYQKHFSEGRLSIKKLKVDFRASQADYVKKLEMYRRISLGKRLKLKQKVVQRSLIKGKGSVDGWNIVDCFGNGKTEIQDSLDHIDPLLQRIKEERVKNFGNDWENVPRTKNLSDIKLGPKQTTVARPKRKK